MAGCELLDELDGTGLSSGSETDAANRGAAGTRVVQEPEPAKVGHGYNRKWAGEKAPKKAK